MTHDRNRILAILNRRDATLAASRDAGEKARAARGRATKRQAEIEALREHRERAGFASEREAIAIRIAEAEAELATLRADAQEAAAAQERAETECLEAGRLAEAVERHCRAVGISLPGEDKNALTGMSNITTGRIAS